MGKSLVWNLLKQMMTALGFSPTAGLGLSAQWALSRWRRKHIFSLHPLLLQAFLWDAHFTVYFFPLRSKSSAIEVTCDFSSWNWLSLDSPSQMRYSWLFTVDCVSVNNHGHQWGFFSNLTERESGLVSRSTHRSASMLAKIALSIARLAAASSSCSVCLAWMSCWLAKHF